MALLYSRAHTDCTGTALGWDTPFQSDLVLEERALIVCLEYIELIFCGYFADCYCLVRCKVVDFGLQRRAV